MLTGVAFGALPALQAMRADPAETLEDGAGSVSAGRRGGRVRSGLVVAEIALAAVLVTGAGLLMRSLVAQVQTEAGFDPAGLVVLSLSLGAGYDAETRLQFGDAILERVRGLPGTRSAAAGWASPFERTGQSRCCWRDRIVGDPSLVDDANPFRGMLHPVTPGYFRTLGATVAFGRELQPTDGDRPLAILNRPAAQLLFGTENVVGRTLTLGSQEPETLEVIGVVDGVHEFGPTEGVEEAVYVPYARYGTESYGGLDVLVRSEAGVGSLAPALQESVWALDPDLPIMEIATMERRMSAAVARPGRRRIRCRPPRAPSGSTAGGGGGRARHGCGRLGLGHARSPPLGRGAHRSPHDRLGRAAVGRGRHGRGVRAGVEGGADRSGADAEGGVGARIAGSRRECRRRQRSTGLPSDRDPR